MSNKVLFFLFSFSLIAAACKKEIESYYSSDNLVLLPAGQNCSVEDETSYAFSYRISGMTQQQNLHFFVGNSFFTQNWVESPSSTTARDGLGPLFNTASCSSCHFRDGRGEPFSGNGLLLRLSIPNGAGDPIYGGQLQDNGISTVLKEGTIQINYIEVGGIYNDGTPYSLREPTYTMTNLNYGNMDASVLVSPRVGNQLIGLGLLEIISESDLLAHVDESDLNGDGISGRANYVYDVYANSTVIGRFGWKANTGTLPTQVAAAFNGDLGIKSSLFPNENHTSLQNLAGLPDGGILEISDEDLAKTVLYCRTLAVPNRRNIALASVANGQRIFRDLKCTSCHVETYKTGNEGNISPLKNVEIHPYTDLLLHDMGDDLSDNRPDNLASGNEWRTPPLWGIGLFQTVNNHTFYLHDGRARSIEEAILWHGGEATNSLNTYKALKQSERQALLDFLNSL